MDVIVKMLILRKFVEQGNVCPIHLCVDIYKRAFPRSVNKGRSSYARRRRALELGRCHRCYRVYPPLFPEISRCDNRTCVPGIAYNSKVRDYILWGVTEVIPHPGYNF
uniref:RNA silencing suppressor n=1 Tax=Chrysanthemum virus B TaxID=12165 RepID=Q5F2R9_CVB|nr:hypothetical protein [Chrysanthemum virus B]